MITLSNIYTEIPAKLPQELFETIISGNNFTLERIVSLGHVTPSGDWYDQNRDEWVILLQGSAKLLFRADNQILHMNAGDYCFIPAHKQHRVEWTDPQKHSVWLALHCEAAN